MITSEREYKAILEYVATLMDATPDSNEEFVLSALVDLIVEYENEHYPILKHDPDKWHPVLQEAYETILYGPRTRPTPKTMGGFAAMVTAHRKETNGNDE